MLEVLVFAMVGTAVVTLVVVVVSLLVRATAALVRQGTALRGHLGAGRAAETRLAEATTGHPWRPDGGGRAATGRPPGPGRGGRAGWRLDAAPAAGIRLTLPSSCWFCRSVRNVRGLPQVFFVISVMLRRQLAAGVLRGPRNASFDLLLTVRSVVGGGVSFWLGGDGNRDRSSVPLIHWIKVQGGWYPGGPPATRVSWGQVVGTAVLAGISFTFSLADLALPTATPTHQARVGVLAGVLLSAVLGGVLLDGALPHSGEPVSQGRSPTSPSARRRRRR